MKWKFLYQHKIALLLEASEFAIGFRYDFMEAQLSWNLISQHEQSIQKPFSKYIQAVKGDASLLLCFFLGGGVKPG